MAANLVLENLAVNTEADALAALCNSGVISITNASATVLALLAFGATAFASAAAGVITANAITAEASALASGTASIYKVYKSDGSTLIWTGTVGTSAADLIMNSVTIAADAQVTITSLVHTVPKSA